MLTDFSQLTGVGVAGLSVYLIWKLAANHVEHNTQAIMELKDAINKLIELIERKM